MKKNIFIIICFTLIMLLSWGSNMCAASSLDKSTPTKVIYISNQEIGYEFKDLVVTKKASNDLKFSSSNKFWIDKDVFNINIANAAKEIISKGNKRVYVVGPNINANDLLKKLGVNDIKLVFKEKKFLISVK